MGIELPPIACVLQWGRDVIVADGSAGAVQPAAHFGFNGAATLSSRMGPISKLPVLGRYKLQWGRDVIVADGAAEAAQETAQEAASMGPRRYRRGWVTSAGGGSSGWSFNGAATLSSRMGFKGGSVQGEFVTSLQWGRDVIVADGRRESNAGADRYGASMGPRRYRRGWPNSRATAGVSCPCFNGAATLSSRMGRTPRDVMQ